MGEDSEAERVLVYSNQNAQMYPFSKTKDLRITGIEPAGPIGVTEAEFDPDSQDEQPVAGLQSLIQRLENEADALHLNSFSQADALALGLMLVDLATQRNLPIAIDIRRNNHVLFHVSLPPERLPTTTSGSRERAGQRSDTPNRPCWLASKAGSAAEDSKTTDGSTRDTSPPTAEPSRLMYKTQGMSPLPPFPASHKKPITTWSWRH